MSNLLHFDHSFLPPEPQSLHHPSLTYLTHSMCLLQGRGQICVFVFHKSSSVFRFRSEVQTERCSKCQNLTGFCTLAKQVVWGLRFRHFQGHILQLQCMVIKTSCLFYKKMDHFHNFKL